MAVVAMGGKEIVPIPDAGNCSCAGGLLSDIDMIVPLEIAALVEADEGLFEMADEEHPAAKLEEPFPWQLGEHGLALF